MYTFNLIQRNEDEYLFEFCKAIKFYFNIPQSFFISLRFYNYFLKILFIDELSSEYCCVILIGVIVIVNARLLRTEYEANMKTCDSDLTPINKTMRLQLKVTEVFQQTVTVEVLLILKYILT